MTGLNKPPTLRAKTGHAPGKSADDDKALAACDAAIRKNPNSAAAYIKRSALWQARGNPDKAVADYRRAHEIDPEGVPEFSSPDVAKAFNDSMEEFDVLYKKLAES